MPTVTVRISERVKEDLLNLKNKYALEGTDISDAVTISDTAWFDYILKLGMREFERHRESE